MEELFTTHGAIALLTLTALEIVLGIDNIVFIAIIAGRVKEGLRKKARSIGLLFAMLTRIVLLMFVGWIVSLTEPLFELLSRPFSVRDIVLFAGGLFLIAKATHEIHEKIEGGAHGALQRRELSFSKAIFQIVLIDIIFSLDSVITAVGMVNEVPIMILAVIISIGVMMIFAGKISHFVETHPTLKMLALSFLILIGVMLVAESFGTHVEKGYIYFAMAFSLVVEMLNIRVRGVPQSKTEHA